MEEKKIINGITFKGKYGVTVITNEGDGWKRSTELDKLCDSRDEAIKYIKSLDTNLLSKANEELCKKVKVESQNLINTLTLVCSQEMKNGYSRFDN
mgnify:CR=1 FL=1